MAKNVGLIKISGKVGDLQFFNKDGKSYVGLTSNISKERIKKDPAFKRTRENMAEFGGAAGVSKNIRSFLIPLKSLFEKNLHARFTSLIRIMMNVGSGVRGKRAVEFSLNQDELLQYELNEKSKISEIMYANMAVATNTERNQAVLTIDEFLPSDYLLIPEGATHYRIHLAALSISDYAPQGVKSKYKPLNTAQHGLFEQASTAELTIDSAQTGGITLTVDLPGAPTLDPEVSLFTFVGIEFLQGVNGNFYQFATNNAIRIEKVF
jgi:hypothetical protein